LNAFKNGRITGLGRKLARLPVDPRACVRVAGRLIASLARESPNDLF
jgi:hypothetical protein